MSLLSPYMQFIAVVLSVCCDACLICCCAFHCVIVVVFLVVDVVGMARERVLLSCPAELKHRMAQPCECFQR